MTDLSRWVSVHEFECEHCGDLYEATRFDSRFCSSRCRTANHRLDAKRKKRIENARKAVNELIAHTPRVGNSEALQELVTLQKIITSKINSIDGVNDWD